MNKFETQQAYLAMFEFLDSYYQLTKSDDIGVLLGSMSLLQDGKPADSALWNDWLRATEKVKQNMVDAELKLKK